MITTVFLKSTAGLGVREPAVVSGDPAEDVEDVRVGLLDLVEEEHRVRPAAWTVSVSCPASS